MEHAEAHERLADLALEPARLAELDREESDDAVAIRRHVAGCEACIADLAAYRRAWSELGDALTPRAGSGAGDPGTGAGVLRAPAALRDRVLAAVADGGPSPLAVLPRGIAEAVSGGPASVPAGGRQLRTPARLPWLAVAAALVVAIGAGSLAWSAQSSLDRARADTAKLASVAATLDRVFADPVHWVTPLRTTDGGPGGTLVWSDTDLVVFSTALPKPGPGLAYGCWIERDGARTPIGSIEFAGDTGYWVGSMRGWTDAFASGSLFGVSLNPVGGGAGTPVLLGTL